MGFSHVEATQLFCEGGAAGREHQSLLFTTFPVVTQVSTQSASHLITCSSAAATALSCGEKTTNYVMGMDKDKKRKLNSITHQLKEKGYKIGIITSAPIDHATPGGFYASQPSRKMYYEIGQDAANSNFDFFAGAGLAETRSRTN
ncbi:MAG: alkaline phosphatase, partial [Bacteroides sp.]